MPEIAPSRKNVTPTAHTTDTPGTGIPGNAPMPKRSPQNLIAQNKHSPQNCTNTSDTTRDLVFALDPVVFSRDCLGITPDTWQAQVLRSAGKRTLLNCSRQSGKSTTAAVLALHRALFYPGSLVLLVSPSLRQSSELFRKVTDMVRRLPEPPGKSEDNRLSCTFQNASRIVSLPGTEQTIRGYSSVNLVIEDEAARVPDDLYRAVRPMLAVSGGRIVLMSTPFGKRGHFHDEWTGIDQWERIEIPASKCARISRAFLEEERRALGDWWYRQEYECQFVETTDAVFSYDLVIGALSDDIEPLFPVIPSPRIPAYLPHEMMGSDEPEPLFPGGAG